MSEWQRSDHGPAPPPSPSLLAQVEKAGPVKTRRPLRAAAGIALVSLASALSLLAALLGLRDDLRAIPPLPLVLYAAACLVSFGGQLAAALVPARGEVLPSAQSSTWMVAVCLGLTVPLGFVVGTHAHPDWPWRSGDLEDFWTHALPCLGHGLAVAAVPALLGVRALRRVIPHGSWRTTLPVGGACGVLAGLILPLHCPRADLVHVGLVHGAVMVLPALLLALLGMWLLAASAHDPARRS